MDCGGRQELRPIVGWPVKIATDQLGRDVVVGEELRGCTNSSASSPGNHAWRHLRSKDENDACDRFRREDRLIIVHILAEGSSA